MMVASPTDCWIASDAAREVSTSTAAAAGALMLANVEPGESRSYAVLAEQQLLKLGRARPDEMEQATVSQLPLLSGRDISQTFNGEWKTCYSDDVSVLETFPSYLKMPLEDNGAEARIATSAVVVTSNRQKERLVKRERAERRVAEGHATRFRKLQKGSAGVESHEGVNGTIRDMCRTQLLSASEEAALSGEIQVVSQPVTLNVAV